MSSSEEEVFTEIIDRLDTESTAKCLDSIEEGFQGMTPRGIIDEVDIDFSDTRTFCVVRWDDIAKTAIERLTASGNYSPS